MNVEVVTTIFISDFNIHFQAHLLGFVIVVVLDYLLYIKNLF